MLVLRGSNVVDGGPTLNQHCFNVLCPLGTQLDVSEDRADNNSDNIIYVYNNSGILLAFGMPYYHDYNTSTHECYWDAVEDKGTEW